MEMEVENGKYKPGGRLDMSHGFLQHIRRNQIARDDYDREVKQAKEKKRHRHTNNPRQGDDWNDSSSGTEQENPRTELFWLDYQADSGKTTSFIVHKEDKPEWIVKKVAEKNILDPGMRAALLARVGEEMNKRCYKS
ncbi:hypothetical protein DNTS_034508 [Danionella cerebrum]|uniref:Uncharacterized protein n=1 Tax=Danionella cerebrum TaxID=2873325 RepID=A0A553MPG6_9TELE|nr:hypothetical protein DNTS_034508 [Danionella translucida]